MIVHLDTSVLIDVFTRPFRSKPGLAALVAEAHRVAISAPVLYEWLRGPRLETELLDVEAVLPADQAAVFGHESAAIAARLYRAARRARGREIDIMIAACAIEHGAPLWTLNPEDFEDIPGLTLYRASR